MSSTSILIINPHGIGDVLFTTPVVSNLRRAYPDAHIAYIGNRRTEGFLKNDPRIDQVLVYERDEFHAQRKHPIAYARKWADFARTIREGRFDIVFDLSMNNMFGFGAWFCGIPKRIGYDYKGRGRFLTHKFPLKGYEGRHVIDHYLSLLEGVGVPVVDRAMQFPITPADEAWAGAWLKAEGIDPAARPVAVVPGGGASWGKAAGNKRWPAGKYAGLVDKIIADSHAPVILMGDSGEAQLCKEVASLVHFPLHSAVGKTTLGQMAALLKLCRLAIVNDGGPLHVAVAAGTRTVSIFGPVDPVVYGPYPAQAHTVVTKGLACQPCYRRFRMSSCSHLSCLQDLSVEDVYRKATIER